MSRHGEQLQDIGPAEKWGIFWRTPTEGAYKAARIFDRLGLSLVIGAEVNDFFANELVAVNATRLAGVFAVAACVTAIIDRINPWRM